MKILLTGNHNPHFTNTVVYREKAIKELGHEVIFFGDRSFLLPGRIRQRIDFLQRWDLKRLNSNLIKLASKKKPDLCIVVGGYRTSPDALSAMKNRGIRTVLWTTDAPRHFENIIKMASVYDYIFCSGTEAIIMLKNRGIEKIFWLPFACDEEYHQPVTLSEKEKNALGKDIVFVGSFYPNRADILEGISDMNIAVWGPNWGELKRHSPLKNKVMDAKLDYDQWRKIYSASKIVLVIHYNDGKTPCDQASPRLFEAMACGSFVMADGQKDARALFGDKEQVVFFDGVEDLRKKILYYLDHPLEMKEIAQKGREEVLARHTYKRRIEDMLSVIKDEEN